LADDNFTADQKPYLRHNLLGMLNAGSETGRKALNDITDGDLSV